MDTPHSLQMFVSVLLFAPGVIFAALVLGCASAWAAWRIIRRLSRTDRMAAGSR
ncbi:MAG: hypothetical protein H6707_18860 [Deltaproteobacteria bacterium]|nr:hypothetical protein [Deltaproteobacteria bacterium]